MDELIPRNHYLDQFRALRDKPLIKVITGIRRCGKSTLMMMFRDELVETGVPEKDIYFINFGNELDSDIKTHKELIDSVKSRFVPGKGKYIFLDEIQDVLDWERAVETFYIHGVDIYVTGSSSKMVSTEISTKLSGRYVTIDVLPLSFSEFLLFRDVFGKEASLEKKFDEYIRWGSLPMTAILSGIGNRVITDSISGSYNSVFIKDIVERNCIRNAPVIQNISRFLMKNIGNRTSVANVAGYLSSKRMKTSSETIDSYIGYLENAELFRRARRMDVKTREYLCTLDKFYVSDIGVRNVIVGFMEDDLNGILENLVFNELLFRFGNASVLSLGDKEVDFISFDDKGEPSYYQVSFSISDKRTRNRELSSLRAIDDNYPKTVIVMDRCSISDIDGIKIVNLIDFLIESYEELGSKAR